MNTPTFRPAPWIWPFLIALMAVQMIFLIAWQRLGGGGQDVATLLFGLAALVTHPRLLKRGAVWALWGLLLPLVLGLVALVPMVLFHASQADVWPWLSILTGAALGVTALNLGPVLGFCLGILTARDPDLLQEGRFRRPPLRGLALLAGALILAVAAGQWFGGPSRFAEAAWKGDLSTCRQLARRNARLAHATFEGAPILMLAVRADDLETVDLLLQHGADPRAFSERYGRATALHWVCLDASVKDHQQLIDGGGCRARRGATHLKTAPRLAQLLLEVGADPNALDSGLNSPLGWAASQGFQDLVELLDRGGARLNAMPKWKGPRILRDAVGLDAVKTVAWLLDQGVSPRALPPGGPYDGVDDNPLSHVQSPTMAQLLVARGANVREQNRFGETPLHWLLRHRATPKVVETLIELGAPLDIPDRKGITAAQAMEEWRRERQEAELTFSRLAPSQEKKSRD